MSKALEQLAERFPQLYIPPAEGASQGELYRAVTRRGERHTGSLRHFIGSEEDSLTTEHTPAGEAEILFLKNRADFECCCRIMAHRCEPVTIPETMGATYIGGINDWSRIHAHMEAYCANGGTDYNGEFARFTAVRENYKTALIILSEGAYSGLPAEKTPYAAEEWLRLSREIRKYHELTHFVCRRLLPDKKYPVWDELLADHLGLLLAVGVYDKTLALAFLGIENGRYTGGRLKNYLDAQPDAHIVSMVLSAADRLEECSNRLCAEGLCGYELAVELEKKAEELGAF